MKNNAKETIDRLLHSGQELHTGCQPPDLERFKKFELSQSKNDIQYSKEEEEEILKEMDVIQKEWDEEDKNNGEENIST